jgi:hypothetical protein
MMHSTRIVSVMLRRQRLTTYMHRPCQFLARGDFSLWRVHGDAAGLKTQNRLAPVK